MNLDFYTSKYLLRSTTPENTGFFAVCKALIDNVIFDFESYWVYYQEKVDVPKPNFPKPNFPLISIIFHAILSIRKFQSTSINRAICILLGLFYQANRPITQVTTMKYQFTKEDFAYAKQTSSFLYGGNWGHSV